jgi:hypothetical protein
MTPRAPHVHRQRGHQQRRDDRQDSFPQRLVPGLGQQQTGANAEQDRRPDPPVDGGNQLASPRFPEVSKADGDDEEGFDPFPQRDHEGLEHSALKSYDPMSDQSSRHS